MITCCRYCENRVIGCHSTCEQYIKEKEQDKLARDAKWQRKEISVALDKLYRTRYSNPKRKKK